VRIVGGVCALLFVYYVPSQMKQLLLPHADRLSSTSTHLCKNLPQHLIDLRRLISRRPTTFTACIPVFCKFQNIVGDLFRILRALIVRRHRHISPCRPSVRFLAAPTIDVQSVNKHPRASRPDSCDRCGTSVGVKAKGTIVRGSELPGEILAQRQLNASAHPRSS